MRKFNAKRAVLILSALFIVLIGMIAVLRSGQTQAVLTESEEQILKIEMSTLDVAILENGEETDTLLSNLEKLDPGYPYSEVISVKNTGAYDEYVRVIVRKYWVGSDGKRLDLSPEYIHLVPDKEKGWTENGKEGTAERSVWYCKKSLAVDEESKIFEAVYIDGKVFDNVKPTTASSEVIDGETYTTTITQYDYDDITFVIEVEAQAIQYESANQAIVGAWGVTNVTASGGTVTIGS